MDVLGQLTESWQINNRVNLFLLDHISDEGLECSLSKRGGRNIMQQFIHLHNVRRYRVEKFAKKYLDGIAKLDPQEKFDKRILQKHLTQSCGIYTEWIKDAVANDGKVTGFKRGIIPMVSYFINHEAHHRGSILLTLKACGQPVKQPYRDQIWAWNAI